MKRKEEKKEEKKKEVRKAQVFIDSTNKQFWEQVLPGQELTDKAEIEVESGKVDFKFILDEKGGEEERTLIFAFDASQNIEVLKRFLIMKERIKPNKFLVLLCESDVDKSMKEARELSRTEGFKAYQVSHADIKFIVENMI